MIDEDIKSTIKAELESLPTVVQNAILHSGWQEKVRAIGKKYSLHIDQIGVLENQTFIIMLGLDNPDSFTVNLASEAGISSLTAGQISLEVNDTIFKPIRTELQKIEAEEITEEEHPSKESVLDGIENPTPAVHAHEAFQPLASQLAMPAPLDTGTPTPKPAPIAPVLPPTIHTTAVPKVMVMPNAGTSNIVHDRLSQMVQMAKKEIQTAPATPAPKDASKSTVDPYREAV